MERMLTAMADNPAATWAGLFAMTCLATWPLFRTRSMMLSTYVGNNLGSVVHYALLDYWTAVFMNALIAAQTVAVMGLARYPRLRLVYFALIPLMLGVTILTWQGLPSLLSAAATALSTIGRIQHSEALLRVLILASMPLWAAHDIAVGSLPGLVADLLSMATGAIMLMRHLSAARFAAPALAATAATPISNHFDGLPSRSPRGGKS